MSTSRGGKSQSIKSGLIHLNEEKQLNIELAHFCAIYLYAKVDTTIKGKERQRSGASYKIIIDIDNTGKSRKKRRAS